MQTTIDTSHHAHAEDHLFDLFSASINDHFDKMKGRPLFTCDAVDLYSIYLDSFNDPVNRQYHNCNCCRQFIQRFGNLVVIDPETGAHTSAIWPSDGAGIPAMYADAASKLSKAVKRAKVNGVFVSSDKTWGTPVTGPWSHFNVKPSAVHRDRLHEPHQVMAQKNQDFGTLSHGLADFSIDTVKTAISLLDADALYRAEKVIGPATFLFELHKKIDGIKNRELRSNLIWHSVATAPVGFATPRSSMIGTLMEDIASGKSFEQVKRSFAAKMHPLQYRRPQAPASDGNIEQAEKIVEKLGIANSLKRRFARIEEMKLLWSPTPDVEDDTNGGVFVHLKNKGGKSDPIVADGGNITWVKFSTKVLPDTKKIQVLLSWGPMNFTGVLTAVYPDAPPILQWDSEESRNPVSWYCYSGGSMPSQWGLAAGTWEDVGGVSLLPSMWDDEDRFKHFMKCALFILPRAKDRQNIGLSLFPEMLRSELHSIRSTIEAFSRSGNLEGREEGTANGVATATMMPIKVRVTTSLGVTEYRIDRWD